MATMPVEKGFHITSRYGNRAGGFHWGTDYGRGGGSGGFPVFAVKSGTVTRAGAASGFGRWVTVDHPASNGGGETVYGHIVPEVTVGQAVSEGQRIARIDPSSATNGGVAPHLHFEWHRYAWSPPGDARLDPETMLAGARWPGEAPVGGLTADVLARAMGCTVARAAELLDPFMGAMRAADVNTVERAAMFIAQIGHESAGLRYMEEIASGAAYEGRADLGNTQPGDGVRFKGSGPIQLTGRANFRAFTRWANSQGHTSLDFEAKPELVRTDPRWGFLAASWYWTVARPQINSLADRGDLEGVTRAINGGLNGLADRRERFQRARGFGAQLLPKSGGLTVSEADRIIKHFEDFIKGYLGPLVSDVKDVREQITGSRDSVPGDLVASYKGWPQLGRNAQGNSLGLVDGVAALRRDVDEIRKAVGQ